ncbi:uncharacterized protein LOC129241317 [Anastrepha obliqua]|uniref:uncharacterized protein LOC129241317 n=1 Tax=Anastrepha obliqua TaxID=95512 RepID=UPI002409A861|nr:uncharacterized protein LOC129241317 [Anastrepha obliqua]
MQRFIITLALVCGSFCSSWALPPANAPAVSAPAQPPTLTQDIEELHRLIPSKPLNKLVIRYLLNDAEFQAVIRIINSHDAFMVRMRLYAQPEIIQFQSWVRSQLLLSGGGSFEFEESEEILSLFNPTPYWSVYGWQGFFNEFLAYFPQEMLRAQINAKVIQGGSLAQFWTKLKALQPVYERVLAFPESKRIIAQLEQNGVNFAQVDQFIRSLFDWYNLTSVDVNAQGVGAVNAPIASPAVNSIAA